MRTKKQNPNKWQQQQEKQAGAAAGSGAAAGEAQAAAAAAALEQWGLNLSSGPSSTPFAEASCQTPNQVNGQCPGHFGSEGSGFKPRRCYLFFCRQFEGRTLDTPASWS